jgi:hypothetical protein
MNDWVSHAYDIGPGNVRIALPDRARKVSGGLSNDLERVKDGKDFLFVRGELGVVQFAHKLQSLCRIMGYVAQVVRVTLFRLIRRWPRIR